jgi:hypothetical protein
MIFQFNYSAHADSGSVHAAEEHKVVNVQVKPEQVKVNNEVDIRSAILTYVDVYRKAYTDGDLIVNNTIAPILIPTNICDFVKIQEKCVGNEIIWKLIINNEEEIIIK